MAIREAYFASAFMFLILSCRFGWLWWKGSLDGKSMTQAMELLSAIVMGTSVAMIIATELPAPARGEGFACQRMNSVYWVCGGWPVVSDFVASMLIKLLNWFEAGAGIPAASAPLLGHFFIVKKLSEGDLSPAEVFKAFCAGSFIFLVLLRLDLVLSFFNTIVEQLSFLSMRTEEGKAVMVSWARSINEYSAYAKNNWSLASFDVLFLWFGIGFLGLVLNIGSSLFVMVQCSILVFAPFAFFRGLLYDRADIYRGIRLTSTFSVFMLFQNLVWTILSFFPTVASPQMVGDEMILETSCFEIMGSMVGAGCLILVLYAAVLYICYLILKKTFGGDE